MFMQVFSEAGALLGLVDTDEYPGLAAAAHRHRHGESVLLAPRPYAPAPQTPPVPPATVLSFGLRKAQLVVERPGLDGPRRVYDRTVFVLAEEHAWAWDCPGMVRLREDWMT